MQDGEYTKEYVEMQHKQLAAKDAEIERLKEEVKQLEGLDADNAAWVIALAAELPEEVYKDVRNRVGVLFNQLHAAEQRIKELERKLTLVKEHALINFDNDLLKLVDAKNMPDNWHCPRCNAAKQTRIRLRGWEQTPPNRNKGHLAAFYLGHETARSEVRAILDGGKEGEDEG